MAKIYQVNSPEQAVLIDKIKNSGCEVIQVSNGLIDNPNLSKDAKVLAGITQSS